MNADRSNATLPDLILESIALDDSCQRRLYARGVWNHDDFRDACANHIARSHGDCCIPRLSSIRVVTKYMRKVPIHGNDVADSQHVLSDRPSRGAFLVTMLDEWLPLHPCSAVKYA